MTVKESKLISTDTLNELAFFFLISGFSECHGKKYFIFLNIGCGQIDHILITDCLMRCLDTFLGQDFVYKSL